MLRRFTTSQDFSYLTKKNPEKSLIKILPKTSGRNASGKITSRHIGGRSKRYFRTIDFKRDKYNLIGKVVAIEYDPNRTSNIALIQYPDGEKRYILHPEGLIVGATVIAGKEAEIKLGNSVPLVRIPIGTPIHNLELTSGMGGQIVRGAGTSAIILAKEGEYVTIKLPSGETRLVHKDNFATIGVVGNADWKNMVWGSAGRRRHMGHRPKVRGTAQNPRTHPHGGGEGRSGVGLKQPKTPWGKPARGLRTRKLNKYSNRFIIKRKG